MPRKLEWPIVLTMAALIFTFAFFDQIDYRKAYRSNLTVVPVITPTNPYTKQYAAALDVANVFGRSPGCSDASPILITEIAQEAVKVEIDPRVLAATIAVESACNQYATSAKGAIGLMQVVPRVWKDKYNFEHDFNLLNPTDNITVGAEILSGLIKQYGAVNGLRRYNGLDTTNAAYDAGYTDKITLLAKGVK